jgi:hypothetical protein
MSGRLLFTGEFEIQGDEIVINKQLVNRRPTAAFHLIAPGSLGARLHGYRNLAGSGKLLAIGSNSIRVSCHWCDAKKWHAPLTCYVKISLFTSTRLHASSMNAGCWLRLEVACGSSTWRDHLSATDDALPTTIMMSILNLRVECSVQIKLHSYT